MISCGTAYLNQLEPGSLIDSFSKHPPVGFTPLKIGGETPAFYTPFDILTTLDDDQQAIADRLHKIPFINRFLRVNTVFAGTTVSEYFVLPANADKEKFVQGLLDTGSEFRATLLIVKDIPMDSPLLTTDENEAAKKLVASLEQKGFQTVAGMALAYVPIDFDSMDDYFKQRLSYTRRKEMKRKLRSRASLTIDELPTGDARFFDDAFVGNLYNLYLNVFAQSKYHFDKLTLSFFQSVLQDAANNGVVFLYTHMGELIGFNLLFEHNGNLVDKYIGLSYPAARDTNLYFVSWFVNLEYALKRGLKNYIAGWTDPEVKAALGAKFTFTQQAVYPRNALLRMVLKKLKRFFESDQNWAEERGAQ